MPSITIDDNGFISIIFSGSSAAIGKPPSLYFSRKNFSDTSFPEPVLLKSGVGGVNSNRWGDYFSLVNISANEVVGIGTVSASNPAQTSIYTQKLTFPGIFMELECSTEDSDVDISLSIKPYSSGLYISQTGNDNENISGNINEPFNTLSYAISRITDENKIYLREGSYEMDETNINNSVSISSYNNENVVIDGSISIENLKDIF